MKIPETIAEHADTMTDDEILDVCAKAGMAPGQARFLLELVRGRASNVLGPTI